METTRPKPKKVVTNRRQVTVLERSVSILRHSPVSIPAEASNTENSEKSSQVA